MIYNFSIDHFSIRLQPSLQIVIIPFFTHYPLPLPSLTTTILFFYCSLPVTISLFLNKINCNKPALTIYLYRKNTYKSVHIRENPGHNVNLKISSCITSLEPSLKYFEQTLTYKLLFAKRKNIPSKRSCCYYQRAWHHTNNLPRAL